MILNIGYWHKGITSGRPKHSDHNWIHCAPLVSLGSYKCRIEWQTGHESHILKELTVEQTGHESHILIELTLLPERFWTTQDVCTAPCTSYDYCSVWDNCQNLTEMNFWWCYISVVPSGYWKYEKDWNAEQHKVTVLQGPRGNDYSLQGVDLQDLSYFGLGIIESMESVMLDLPHIYTDLLKRTMSELRVISGWVRLW